MVPETADTRRRRLVAAVVGTILAVGLLALPGASAPAAAAYWDNVAAAGEHTLVVLPVYWTSPDSQTTTSLRALARKTGDYWSEQTNGVISVPDAKITVRDWMPIAAPVGCDKDAIFYAALAAANERAGSYHKHVIIYFPQTAYCTWQGSASVYPEYEGNIYHQVYGWIWINGYTSADVWQRGFGRNLGLGHARAGTCTSAGVQVPLSETCAFREDYDHDLMGAHRDHDGFSLNTALADRIGLLDPAAVRTAGVGDTFTLSPVSAHTGLRAVKVKLSEDSFLYFEYRPSTGRDAAQPPGWSGVQVRQRETWDYSSRLLALSPDGADGLLANAAARVGVRWRIPGTYMDFVVDSQGPAGAQIRFAALPDSTPPPAPAAPTVAGTATVSGDALRDGILGGEIGVSWSGLVDPESGIASYTLYLDDEVLRTVPGTATAALLPELPSGPHRVRLDATNNAGMTTPGPETSFTTAAAAPAPQAPTVTASSSGWMLGGEVMLDWPAVADPDLVGYEVFVDETLLSTVGAGTTRHPVGTLSSGTHSARVVAVNGIGLGTSSSVTVFGVDASGPPEPPAPTVSAAVQQRGFVRGDLQVSWPSVLDPDSGVDRYRLYLDDTLVATTSNGGHPVSVSAQADGLHRIRVDAVNGAGLTSTGATATVRVDGTGPVLPAPVLAVRSGAATAGIPVTIETPASDAGSGICAVTTSVDGAVVGSGSTVPATVSAGRVVSVQVMATDCIGNGSTVAREVAVAQVPEKAGRFSPGWVVRRSRGYTGGAARISRKRGASVTFSFVGSQVAWMGSRSPRSGLATVYLDGRKVAVVDSRGRAAHRQLLWATSTTEGRHTVRIVVAGTPRRPVVTIDSLVTVRSR